MTLTAYAQNCTAAERTSPRAHSQAIVGSHFLGIKSSAQLLCKPLYIYYN